MNGFIKIIIGLFLFLTGTLCQAQDRDSTLQQMLAKHHQTFSYQNGRFEGEGWKEITANVQQAANVLIGEDHFTNEVPAFTEALLDVRKFDNLIIEVDPYSTEIMEASMQNMDKDEKASFNEKYRQFFSFYALQPEYKLLEQAVEKGINLLGAEQIVKFADPLILQELAARTQSEEAGKIYREMMRRSLATLAKFSEDSEQQMHFMSQEYGQQLGRLQRLDLSMREDSIIADMSISRSIYRNSDHEKRIQLIKRILLDHFPAWYRSSNLFKYGAVHMPRGQSLLRIFDVGNLVSNVSDARFKPSYHLMIFGMSGMKGAPFRHYPDSPVDTSTGMLSRMAPFFEVMVQDRWYAFDMRPLRNAMRQGRLNTDSALMRRVIEGYDTVVIIPEVTAAGF